MTPPKRATPLFKTLVIVALIIFPIIGFISGTKYQSIPSSNNSFIYLYPTGAINNQNWKTFIFSHYMIDYPPDWEIYNTVVDRGYATYITNNRKNKEGVTGSIGEGAVYGVGATEEPKKQKIGNYIWDVRYFDKNSYNDRLYMIGENKFKPDFSLYISLPKDFPQTYSVIEQILSTLRVNNQISK